MEIAIYSTLFGSIMKLFFSIFLFTFTFTFTSIVNAHDWDYTASAKTAHYIIDSDNMASVSIVAGVPTLRITNMSGKDSCGFHNNPPASMISATVNGNETKLYTFCQTYQRVYLIATKTEQKWVIGNLWNENTVTISTKGHLFEIGTKNFQSAVSNMSF